MLKKLLLTTLLTTSIFGVELVVDAKFIRDDVKEIVTNDVTGLVFQDNSATRTVQKDWRGAIDYCHSLNFAGFDDWYLPGIKELKSIIDTTKHKPAIKDGFKQVTSNYYWSSSPYVSFSYSKLAWSVYFKSGDSYYSYKTDELYVRCARAGQ